MVVVVGFSLGHCCPTYSSEQVKGVMPPFPCVEWVIHRVPHSPYTDRYKCLSFLTLTALWSSPCGCGCVSWCKQSFWGNVNKQSSEIRGGGRLETLARLPAHLPWFARRKRENGIGVNLRTHRWKIRRTFQIFHLKRQLRDEWWAREKDSILWNSKDG